MRSVASCHATNDAAQSSGIRILQEIVASCHAYAVLIVAKKRPRGKAFAKGNEVSKGNTASRAQIELDVQSVFARMATGREGMVALWAWCKSQGWSHSHTSTVLRQVKHLLRGVTQEKAEDTRARLLAFIEYELDNHCSEYVTGTGASSKEMGSEGTVFLKDPVTGEHLTKRNHAAIQGYLKLAMRITGIDTLVVEHRKGARPYSEWSTGELEEEIKRLEEAAADEAKLAQVITTNEGESDGR